MFGVVAENPSLIAGSSLRFELHWREWCSQKPHLHARKIRGSSFRWRIPAGLSTLLLVLLCRPTYSKGVTGNRQPSVSRLIDIVRSAVLVLNPDGLDEDVWFAEACIQVEDSSRTVDLAPGTLVQASQDYCE